MKVSREPGVFSREFSALSQWSHTQSISSAHSLEVGGYFGVASTMTGAALHAEAKHTKGKVAVALSPNLITALFSGHKLLQTLLGWVGVVGLLYTPSYGFYEYLFCRVTRAFLVCHLRIRHPSTRSVACIFVISLVFL